MRLKTKHSTEPADVAVGGIDPPLQEVQTDPLTMIDDALARYARPRLVSSREVVDVLLDLRSAVVLDALFAPLLDDFDRVRSGRIGMLPLHEPY